MLNLISLNFNSSMASPLPSTSTALPLPSTSAEPPTPTGHPLPLTSMAGRPAYADVYNLLPDPPLAKVDVMHDLSQLHSQYWSKNINADADDQTSEQLPDVDESEVVRGCFNLTIRFPGNNEDFSKLWVRKDYIRIYDYCEGYDTTIGPTPPSIIISGQPGVGECFSSDFSCSRTFIPKGKTVWIDYAIRRRLGEAKPFIWYYDSHWYLFVEGGVFHIPCLLPSLFRPYIWTFIDANNIEDGFLVRYAQRKSKLFILFTTSPDKKHWSPLLPNSNPETLIMNPWTWDEMEKA